VITSALEESEHEGTSEVRIVPRDPAMPWGRRHVRPLFAWLIVALLSVFGILVLLLLISRVMDTEGAYHGPTTPRVANQALAARVRRLARVMDSLTAMDGISLYKLHVVVDKTAHFVPAAIQLRDDTGQSIGGQHKTVATRGLSCFRVPSPLRFEDKLTYETDWFRGSPFAHSKKARVVLSVRDGGSVYSVEGVVVTDTCLWATL